MNPLSFAFDIFQSLLKGASVLYEALTFKLQIGDFNVSFLGLLAGGGLLFFIIKSIILE